MNATDTLAVGFLEDMMPPSNPHLPPFFTDPERGQVTRLEVEATIPPAASPSQPLLIVSLQEEQDKCKGMSEV